MIQNIVAAANGVLSLFAIIISVFSLRRSVSTDRFNEIMRKYELENDLLNRISSAKLSYVTLFEKTISLAEPEEKKELYRLALEERVEEYLYALEYACDKLFDGVLDESSFLRNFAPLVIVASEDEVVSKQINQNKYVSLTRAYRALMEEENNAK